MGEVARKFNIKATKATDSLELIKSTHTEEIVIALCGQLGTDLKIIEEILVEELRTIYNYDTQVIKLSDYISKYTDVNLVETTSEYYRITTGMDKGNELRAKYGNQILAELAIQDILIDRTEETDRNDVEIEKFNSRRKCYIINSIKHPEELKLFKEVYREIFYVIGVFTSMDLREKNLTKKLGISKSKVYEIIDRDTGEDKMNGQKVEITFIESDYFLRIGTNEKNKIKPKIERFLKILFDVGINTPLVEETAMYQAAAAAANSACLSRQVGACITDEKGSILSLGWNDVPTFGGNLYPNRELNQDMRCFNNGSCECANKVRKDSMIKSIINEIKNEIDWKEEYTVKLISILENNGIKGLIEFARSIHAEMHALIIGSQKTGTQMVGGKLFCTTYPCHNCARHIIVAGIKEVYYIEPYKKSLCIDLHSDAITEDENETSKVRILMYEGVAPKKYMKAYKLIGDDRKEKIKNQNLRIVKPKFTMTLRALHQLEASVTINLDKKFQRED
jgi:deoxycytidylate deaminase